MIRPWHVWTWFTLSACVVLAALAWVSVKVIEADEKETEARRAALLEENIRLSLWRMDSHFSPILAKESARPYFTYSAFYPTERAYTRMFAPLGRGEVLMPSPLLAYDSPYVLLHFQVHPDGRVTSPQVPIGNMRDLAEMGYTSPERIARFSKHLSDMERISPAERIIAAVPAEPVPPRPAVRLAAGPTQANLAAANDTIQSISAGNEQINLSANQDDQSLEQQKLAVPQQLDMQYSKVQQRARSSNEYIRRVDNYNRNQGASQAESSLRWNKPKSSSSQFQSLAQQPENAAPSSEGKTKVSQSRLQKVPVPEVDKQPVLPPASQDMIDFLSDDVNEGLMQPAWVGATLVLLRRVTVGGSVYVQGCQLDWDRLRDTALQEVQDLLPAAKLEPVRNGHANERERMLAALPARLLPGRVPIQPSTEISPLKISLMIVWACVLVAAGAIAALLAGAVALSERRGAFVSSVTHELRTPLTTFRMYAEMLSEGMVPEDKQRKYLTVLCTEANRLSHLVENVLAYARLERGSARGRIEPTLLATLIDPMADRLADRASHAGMTLVLAPHNLSAEVQVLADTAAVEQILFNLVDNACKYAKDAEDKRIHVRLTYDAEWGTVEVQDNGPGIPREEAGRIFHAFAKSARDAANSAPGVGLGLALSRRLARAMHGDLHLSPSPSPGATFTLRLPLQTP